MVLCKILASTDPIPNVPQDFAWATTQCLRTTLLLSVTAASPLVLKAMAAAKPLVRGTGRVTGTAPWVGCVVVWAQACLGR